MRSLFLALALLFSLNAATAQERITSFDSNVIVHKDGALDVTETIEIIADHIQVKRGILRDFPTHYKDRRGLNVNVGFEVMRVQRDGRDEPYAVETIARGKRIRIGDADTLLSRGRHFYSIRYRTTRQLGFFEDFDELYWNVTGNGWSFIIDNARTSITLPQEAVIRQSAAYTGAFGAAGRDFSILNAKGNRFSAKTTRRLYPNEGFTVAVGWQKGVVTPPNETERTLWMIYDNAIYIALLFGFLTVSLYYLYAWRRVGRDPAKGQIVPLFRPPKNLGPAATRYVWRQGFDDTVFAAALIGLATQGRMKISDDDKNFTVQRIARSGSVETKPESEVFNALGDSALTLKQVNRERVLRVKEKLEDSLEKNYLGVMFNRNRLWFWMGAALSMLCLLASAAFLPAGERENTLFFSAFGAIFATAILAVVWKNLKVLFQARGLAAKLGPLIMLLFALPFVAPVAVPTLLALSEEGVSTAVVAYFAVAAALGIMNLVFLNLLYARTEAGRWVADEIEGFRMYLATAEEERLNALNPPEKTPELFERYLPFAIALGCENEWGEKFESVLAAAVAAGSAKSSPSWYSGSSWNSSRVGSFAGSLSSSLVSNVTSASASSSSGSGGGGSSGGGGGGGGGSGW